MLVLKRGNYLYQKRPKAIEKTHWTTPAEKTLSRFSLQTWNAYEKDDELEPYQQNFFPPTSRHYKERKLTTRNSHHKSQSVKPMSFLQLSTHIIFVNFEHLCKTLCGEECNVLTRTYNHHFTIELKLYDISNQELNSLAGKKTRSKDATPFIPKTGFFCAHVDPWTIGPNLAWYRW